MASRGKWALGALTCLVAVLTAATFAQAIEQTAKNGCSSPQAYSGSITTPPFTPLGTGGQGANVSFEGWFEIESINPFGSGIDTITVEYTTPGAEGEWTPVTAPNGDMAAQSQPNNGTTGADIPYSNMGTGVPPSFQNYSFNLPVETDGIAGTQVRVTFTTADASYQGFRGVGIEEFFVSSSTPPITEDFEGGAPGWTLDGASGPGGPFWQIPSVPQNISIRNPDVNPRLVTLSGGDSGALPARPAGETRYAWFGNADSGTFCGPDFAQFDLPPDTTITSGPPASTANNDATFEFSATEPAGFFECQLDGGGFTPCSSPQTYPGLAEGTHTFEVRATDFSGNVDPTPATHTWSIRPATLSDLDNPTLGVDVNVQEVAGTVLVGIPAAAARAAGSGRASQKGLTFVPLSEARQVPVGSFLDTRKGTLRLESATNPAGRRQRGTFLNGLFQVRQSRKRSAKGLTDLVLKGSSFRRCRAGSGKGARAALTRRQIRRLRANARGRFRTSGSNSSATVRGTIWDITDRCDGTLTKVKRGKVVVRDFRRKKNITLRAGKSYLAKAPR
jgi:hypothetical protein